jgi:hypothetical protein
MSVTTTLTIHDLYAIAARQPHSLGAPLVLRCAGHHNDVEITLFLGNPDLVERLVEAINKAGAPADKLTTREDDAAADAAAAAQYAYGTGGRT